MNNKLQKKQIDAKLKSLNDDWVLNSAGTSISCKYVFKSTLAGFMFVTKVFIHAEVARHHPEININQSNVKVTLSTAEVKGLTTADFNLALKFDLLYKLSTESKRRTHN